MGLPKGFKMSEATKLRMSLSHTGMPLSEETKAKLRAKRLGWKMSAESREKMRVSWQHRSSFTLETRQKMAEAHKGLTFSPEHRHNISLARKGTHWSPEQRQKMSVGRMGGANPFYGHSQTAKHREIVSPLMRELRLANWQDSDYVARQMKAMRQHPNRVEMRLAEIISPLGFRYVGDGHLVVGGKCPDFWNGDHKLIELFGDYWHQGEDPDIRIRLFRDVGYACLVIWEHELRDTDKVQSRVREFTAT